MNPGARSAIRYEADETPPARLAFGLGLQLAVLSINSVVLVAAIVFRAGGAEESLFWGVFATVLACGAATALQALRLGRVGAGYVVLTGTSSTFIAVCVTALAEGGPAMLATLVVVSSLVQIALSTRLSLLRRVLTPTVTGTVIMLLPVTVMPILFRMLHQASPDDPAAAGPVSAFVTIAALIGIGLKGTSTLRLWAPAIGVVAGSLVAGWFGIYDTGRVAGAAWFGLPEGQWPGLDLDFGPAFWALLPGFVFVTPDRHHQIDRRRRRDPAGVLAPAAGGGLPIRAGDGGRRGRGAICWPASPGRCRTPPYPIGVPITELTGVAARSVGVAAGAVFIVLAFVPKALALILAIPGPVVAATIMVVMAMLFVAGMREVVQSGADYRTGLIAGVSFWTGAGFQAGMIFPEFFSEFAGGLLQNGMTAGGPHGDPAHRADGADRAARKPVPGMARSGRASQTERVSRRLRRPRRLGGGHGGPPASRQRGNPADPSSEGRRGGGVRRPERPRTAAPASHRPQGGRRRGAGIRGRDRRRRRQPPGPYRVARGAARRRRPIEQEGSLRLLRHFASSIRHQQFHNADVVTVLVDAAAPARGGS